MDPSPSLPLRSLALVVTVRWGESVLFVDHVSPPRTYAVGARADRWLPEEVLGAPRVELARVDGRSVLVGGEPLAFCDERTFEVGGLSVTVALPVRAERPARAPLRVRGALGTLVSAVAHAGAAVACALAAPPVPAAEEVVAERHRALLERHAGTADALAALAAQADPADQPDPRRRPEPRALADDGAPEEADEGAAFEPPRAERRASRFARLDRRARRVELRPDPDLRRDARSFGLAGLLGEVDIGPPDPAWGRRPSAQDLAVAHLWAPVAGEIAGMGLSSVGEGSGMGPVAPKMVALDVGEMGVRPSGLEHGARLAPKISGDVGRSCARDPSAAGAVTLALSVNAEGEVTRASELGSELADAPTIACVVRAFTGLRLAGVTQAGSVTHTVRFGSSPSAAAK